jgi:hypothetical protein
MSFVQLMLGAGFFERAKRTYKPGLPPCPHCGKPTKAVETRFNRRRRVCEEGHSHHTLEITEQALAQYWAIERLEQARRVLREKGYLL